MSRTATTEANQSLLSAAAPIERVLLVTLLDNPGLLKNVDELIDASDFFSDPAKKLFSWIKEEKKQGHSIDAALAMSVFMGDPRVEPYLMDVLSALPSPNALKRQAEELRTLATRHETLKILAASIAAVSEGSSPVESDLSKLTHGIKSAQDRLTSNQKNARSYAQVKDKWKEKFKKRTSGDVSYTPTDYHDLDEIILGLEPEDFVIIGARPSMGKTTFAMNLVENASLNHNKACMVFSMEMPEDSIYQRSLSSVGSVDFEDLRKGSLKVGDFEKIQLAMEKLDGAPIFIDDDPGLSLDQLCARAHRQHAITPLSLIMVDYIQLMKVSKHTLGNRNEGIGEISRGLKQLARDLKCTVVSLSQLSRDLEKRPNKRPINSDLRDSGSIEQDADVIMFVYRDEIYDPETPLKGIVEIIIGKQRNGPLGTAFLSFAKGQSRFSNLDPEQKARLEGIEGSPAPNARNGNGKGAVKPQGFKKQNAAPQVEKEGGTFSSLIDGVEHQPPLLMQNQDHLASVADQLA